MPDAARDQDSLLPWDIINKVVRWLTLVFVVGVGIMLCTTVGSLAYPIGGVGAVLGAFFGLIVFLIFGCCATGAWKDCLSARREDRRGGGLADYMPQALTVKLGGHPDFNVLLTVHAAKNVRVQGRIPWRYPDLYCQVECGKNPLKKTCVKTDGANPKWNESFKLFIRQSDTAILIVLMDQDIFGSTNVGYVVLDVEDHILRPADGSESFPRYKEFPIQAGEGDTINLGGAEAPCLVLSFTPLDEKTQAPMQNGVHSTLLPKTGMDLENQEGYGAMEYLAGLEFRPNVLKKPNQ